MKYTDSYKKKIAKNHLRIISMKCTKHKNEVIIFFVPKNIKKILGQFFVLWSALA